MGSAVASRGADVPACSRGADPLGGSRGVGVPAAAPEAVVAFTVTKATSYSSACGVSSPEPAHCGETKKRRAVNEP
jgi:hypothetical protein